MTDEEAWHLEERFWTGGAGHHREALDPECVMAFPAPAGIIQVPDIARSLAGASRRSSIGTAERHVGRPVEGLLVLA